MRAASTRYGLRYGSRFIGSRAAYTLPTASLAVWLDTQEATSIISASDLLGTWVNKGFAGNAVQATTNRKPLVVQNAINGRPAIQGRHDGTNASNLTITDSAALDYTQFTAFSVISRVADLAAAAEFIAGKYVVSGNQREFRQYLTSSDLMASTISAAGDSTLVAAVLASNATPVATPAIIETVYEGTTLTTRKNGVTSATGTVASVFNGTGGYMLFTRDSAADPFAGYIGEHLFYTRALSANERLGVLAYLAPRWGIAL